MLIGHPGYWDVLECSGSRGRRLEQGGRTSRVALAQFQVSFVADATEHFARYPLDDVFVALLK